MELLTTILLIGGGVVLVLGLIAFMLQRSWGDSLPRRIDISASSASDDTPDRSPSFANDVATDALFDDTDEADEPIEDVAAPIPDSGLMLIDHPLLIEVIEKSLHEGGPATRYVVRDGDDLYVSLDLIESPTERRIAAEMIHKFQTEGKIGVMDMISLASTLGRGR